jgi:hypothetical protein
MLKISNFPKNSKIRDSQPSGEAAFNEWLGNYPSHLAMAISNAIGNYKIRRLIDRPNHGKVQGTQRRSDLNFSCYHPHSDLLQHCTIVECASTIDADHVQRALVYAKHSINPKFPDVKLVVLISESAYSAEIMKYIQREKDHHANLRFILLILKYVNNSKTDRRNWYPVFEIVDSPKELNMETPQGLSKEGTGTVMSGRELEKQLEVDQRRVKSMSTTGVTAFLPTGKAKVVPATFFLKQRNEKVFKTILEFYPDIDSRMARNYFDNAPYIGKSDLKRANYKLGHLQLAQECGCNTDDLKKYLSKIARKNGSKAVRPSYWTFNSRGAICVYTPRRAKEIQRLIRNLRFT